MMEVEIFFVNLTSVVVSFAPSSTVFDIMREVRREKKGKGGRKRNFYSLIFLFFFFCFLFFVFCFLFFVFCFLFFVFCFLFFVFCFLFFVFCFLFCFVLFL